MKVMWENGSDQPGAAAPSERNNGNEWNHNVEIVCKLDAGKMLVKSRKFWKIEKLMVSVFELLIKSSKPKIR